MQFSFLPPSAHLRNPADDGALVAPGVPRILPAEFYAGYTSMEVRAFAVKNGLYNIPTEELVTQLKNLIGTRSAIEIGSGNGALAAALGIPATDNHMQTWPEIQAYYAHLQQQPVAYGANVLDMDAHVAVQHFKPDVVIACWVTHKYNPEHHEREGNMYGVDEEALLAGCQTYVHIGNGFTHSQKPIRSLPYRRYRPKWLVSRAERPELNEICIWGARLDCEPAA